MVNHVQFPGLGLNLTVNRVAVSIGGFNVYWYGVLIAAGLLLGVVFAMHYAPDFGIDGERLTDVVMIGAVMAIVCARAYYVAFSPYEYHSFWEVIDLRSGGIAIYGSLIGAFVFGGLAAKVRRVPILPLFDIVAMGFFIGQAIGRWGNFVNQEAFGCNTTLPWGMISEETQAYLSGMVVTAPAGTVIDPSLPVHPTFLYESLWCLVGLVILWSWMKKRKFNGQLFLMYLTWYGLGRFWIEGLRTDSLLLAGNLRTSQLVALVSVAVSLALHLWLLKKYKDTPLLVPLAVADIKILKQLEANGVSPETLPAGTCHAEFAKATDAMNARLKREAEAPAEPASASDSVTQKTETAEEKTEEAPETQAQLPTEQEETT